MEVFKIYILHIYLWVWAEMKLLCRYTNNERVARLASLYMREHMYATVYVVRNIFS